MAGPCLRWHTDLQTPVGRRWSHDRRRTNVVGCQCGSAGTRFSRLLAEREAVM